MGANGVVFLALLIISILIVFLLDRLLRPGLRGLLEEIAGLPAATDFYLRAFAIVIVLVAFAAVLGTHPDLKDGARFMEGVWAVASRLQEFLHDLLVVVLVYVGLITVLMAALRRKH